MPAQTVVNVHTSSGVVPGLIGGAVVLIGVFIADFLVRYRDRRRRLEDATWDLLAVTRGGMLTGNPGPMTTSEMSARLADFVGQLGRIRTEARWPIRRAREIRAEVEAITLRLMIAVGRWNAPGDAGIPRLGPILGDKLHLLVFGPTDPMSRSKLNEVLQAEGVPTLDSLTADESLNAPLHPAREGQNRSG